MNQSVSLSSLTDLWHDLWQQVRLLLLAGFVIIGYSLLATNQESTPIRTFSVVFASIILEAMPFMLLGAFLGGIIEVFVKRERLMAFLPKRTWITVLFSAGLGLVLPVCECAVVPVVRRLGRKGFPAGAAIAYLLGGPIVNPIVAASTTMAYQFDWRIALLRCGIGYGIAVVIGLCMGWIFRKRPLFIETSHQPSPETNHPHKHTHHDHGTGSCPCHGCHMDTNSRSSLRSKLAGILRHASDDFLRVGHYLVIGAFIAALAQTYIDRSFLLNLSAYPFLPCILMMILAISLNLCSEADAFIAASFRGLIPMPAQMVFMLTGPIFDLKLLLMYQGVFSKRAIGMLAGLILVTLVVVMVVLEICWGTVL